MGGARDDVLSDKHATLPDDRTAEIGENVEPIALKLRASACG
jgi:hypothetical protein